MLKQVGLLSFVMSFASSLAFAQHNCPQGFQYAGTLRGTGSFVSEFNERREVNLPENATLDTSYQQANVRSHGGNSKAHSDLRPKDIPKGIHIMAAGTTDLEKGWAISAPELVVVQPPASGNAPRYKFGMKLYCTVGTSPATRNFGGCDVSVEVCYLPSKSH
jgi:hypothetical protein